MVNPMRSPGAGGRRVLLIAFHYPPASESSGIQRTLKFSQYLPEHGWTPAVLSAHPRVYDRVSSEQLAEVPAGMPVLRAFALDTARHLSIAGRYPRALALPDRHVSWALGGIVQGMALIRRFRPDVLWSTYPIASAQLIGATLARLTGLPWVADLRDSMTEDEYPRDPVQRASFLKLEKRVVTHAARVVFTTPGARAMYAARYPEVPPERWTVIENGFDEENFTRAAGREPPPRSDRARVRLVHSGVLYPSERDPRPFFDALAALKARGVVDAERLCVVLRYTGHDALHRSEIERRGIQDLIELAPPVPYEAALAEQLAADGLLLFQAANCNHQIPAKLYEYLRAGRPILALTDAAGDTAATLRAAGIDSIVALDDAAAIEAALATFLDRIEDGSAVRIGRPQAERHGRRARTGELAALLDAIVASR